MRRDLATALSLVSVVACAVIMSSAYFRYHGQYQTPPPVLNGDFRYWTRDASSNQWKPYLWEVDTFKGPNDTLSVFQKKIEGRDCLALRVFQDGSNDTYDWASLHVRQEMRGQALKTLFISNIGLWVYPTFSYDSEVERYNPLNAFGVEVNDGTNLLWFVFSDANVGVYELVRHRIVVIPTPLGEWSYREINIEHEYREARWMYPEHLSFMLIIGSTRVNPGTFEGYFSGVEVKKGSNTMLCQIFSPFEERAVGPSQSRVLHVGTDRFSEKERLDAVFFAA